MAEDGHCAGRGKRAPGHRLGGSIVAASGLSVLVSALTCYTSKVTSGLRPGRASCRTANRRHPPPRTGSAHARPSAWIATPPHDLRGAGAIATE